MTTVGFIGIGTMGRGMVLNLAKQGFKVIAYTRTRSKIKDVAQDNIIIVSSLEEVWKADVLFTCLPNDAELEDVFQKISSHLPGKTLIDCSTTSIELTEKIGKIALEKGFPFIAAPVTGSKSGAEKGTLLFMLGGEKKPIEKCMPLFKAMGERFVYCGKNPLSQKMKLALNLTMATILQSYLEGITFAMKNGVSLDVIQEVFDHSAVANGIATWKMPLIKQRNFTQPHFKVDLMHKDLLLAESEMKKLKLSLPLAKHITAVFQETILAGYSKEDWCAIVKLLEKKSGIEVK